MNFRQDEEHKDILEMVHEFAVNEVKPLAAEIDRTEEFPMKNVKMMAEMGLMGIPFPEEYGGSGMDTLAYIQTVEEISKYCASTVLFYPRIRPYAVHRFISLEPKNRNRNICRNCVPVSGSVHLP